MLFLDVKLSYIIPLTFLSTFSLFFFSGNTIRQQILLDSNLSIDSLIFFTLHFLMLFLLLLSSKPSGNYFFISSNFFCSLNIPFIIYFWKFPWLQIFSSLSIIRIFKFYLLSTLCLFPLSSPFHNVLVSVFHVKRFPRMSSYSWLVFESGTKELRLLHMTGRHHWECSDKNLFISFEDGGTCQ